MRIDVVDYQDPNAPQRFADSLHHTGFAVLVNHPISFAAVQRVWDEWLAFFASDRKWDYLHGDGEQDGYRPLAGSETAVGATARDIKEYFHWYSWGKQPAECSASAAMLYNAGNTVARTLLGWVDQCAPDHVRARFAMPLPQMLDGSTRTLLRILHYPPLTGHEPAGAIRAAAHEDINLLTVLPSANEPGLQVRDLDGTWHDVPCDPGSIAVNCGDMLDLASGGYYPSTTHRVLNPTGDAAGRSRVSTPLFLHPADEVVLADGRSAFDFLAERIRAISGIDLQHQN